VHFEATVAPDRGFGEEGNESGVPPDSHVVFDARIVDVAPNDRSNRD
jgi:FKBP-type peptidyl-prolyl cis-trans isomerase